MGQRRSRLYYQKSTASARFSQNRDVCNSSGTRILQEIADFPQQENVLAQGGRFLGGLLLLLEGGHELVDHQEEHKGQDQKAEEGGEKVAIGKKNHLPCLGGGLGGAALGDLAQHQDLVAEIDA